MDTQTNHPQGPSDLIFDVTTAEFQRRVLDRSQQVPVVVDFWAEWCGPCRMLGPVLEKAVAALQGKVLLARVDTDREPELAGRYQIRGIPKVLAFSRGSLVDEFTGARDARFVRAFLEGLSPSPEMQALGQAAQHLLRGEAAEAEGLLRPLVAGGGGEGPAAQRVLPAAQLLLGEALLRQRRFAEAAALADQVDPRSLEAEQAERLRQRIGFYRAAEELGEGLDQAEERLGGEAAQAADPGARYALAAALAARGEYRKALSHLLALVGAHRRFRDDAARQAMLILFDELGSEHELTQEYRRRLQVLL